MTNRFVDRPPSLSLFGSRSAQSKTGLLCGSHSKRTACARCDREASKATATRSRKTSCSAGTAATLQRRIRLCTHHELREHLALRCLFSRCDSQRRRQRRARCSQPVSRIKSARMSGQSSFDQGRGRNARGTVSSCSSTAEHAAVNRAIGGSTPSFWASHSQRRHSPRVIARVLRDDFPLQNNRERAMRNAGIERIDASIHPRGD